jgi:hypothetical protein
MAKCFVGIDHHVVCAIVFGISYFERLLLTSKILFTAPEGKVTFQAHLSYLLATPLPVTTITVSLSSFVSYLYIHCPWSWGKALWERVFKPNFSFAFVRDGQGSS